ncbi:MAG: hypothetical protein DMF73_06620, partial [Acidobacteria bacterium]
VQNFEITIRLLGALLSSYQMTGDRRLLNLAEDLGNRLLPVFNSPTGLPYRYVNLKTGAVRGNVTNPAEAGTLLIEFGTLARLTHRQIFYDKAKRALVEVYNRRSPVGLVGTWINVETGQWTDTDSHISGAIDSYYEYLLKCAILLHDQDCRRMWNESIKAINKYLADARSTKDITVLTKRGPSPMWGAAAELWYGHADMNSGQRTTATYGARRGSRSLPTECGGKTVLSPKRSITSQWKSHRRAILFVPRSSNQLIISITSHERLNTCEWARRCGATS